MLFAREYQGASQRRSIPSVVVPPAAYVATPTVDLGEDKSPRSSRSSSGTTQSVQLTVDIHEQSTYVVEKQGPSDGTGITPSQQERLQKLDPLRKKAEKKRGFVRDAKRIIRNIKRAIALEQIMPFLTITLYTVVGAVIFVQLEASEDEARRRLAFETRNRTREQFARRLLINDPGGLSIVSVPGWLVNELVEYESELGAQISMDEKWTMINAMYYCGTIYTTIGYGNIFPVTVGGQLMTVLYAIIGIPLVFTALNDIRRVFMLIMLKILRFIQRLYARVTSARRRYRKLQLNAEDGDLEAGANAEKEEEDLNQTAEQALTGVDHAAIPVSAAVAVTFGWMFLCAGLFCIWETNWSYPTSLYFIFISFSTIGLGDVTPEHTEYMIAVFYFVIIGLSLVSLLIEVIQQNLKEALVAILMKVLLEYQRHMEAGEGAGEATAGMQDVWKKNRLLRISMKLLGKSAKNEAMKQFREEAKAQGIEIPDALRELDPETIMPAALSDEDDGFVNKAMEDDETMTDLSYARPEMESQETQDNFCCAGKTPSPIPLPAVITANSASQTDGEQISARKSTTGTQTSSSLKDGAEAPSPIPLVDTKDSHKRAAKKRQSLQATAPLLVEARHNLSSRNSKRKDEPKSEIAAKKTESAPKSIVHLVKAEAEPVQNSNDSLESACRSESSLSIHYSYASSEVDSPSDDTKRGSSSSTVHDPLKPPNSHPKRNNVRKTLIDEDPNEKAAIFALDDSDKLPQKQKRGFFGRLRPVEQKKADADQLHQKPGIGRGILKPAKQSDKPKAEPASPKLPKVTLKSQAVPEASAKTTVASKPEPRSKNAAPVKLVVAATSDASKDKANSKAEETKITAKDPVKREDAMIVAGPAIATVLPEEPAKVKVSHSKNKTDSKQPMSDEPNVQLVIKPRPSMQAAPAVKLAESMPAKIAEPQKSSIKTAQPVTETIQTTPKQLQTPTESSKPSGKLQAHENPSLSSVAKLEMPSLKPIPSDAKPVVSANLVSVNPETGSTATKPLLHQQAFQRGVDPLSTRRTKSKSRERQPIVPKATAPAGIPPSIDIPPLKHIPDEPKPAKRVSTLNAPKRESSSSRVKDEAAKLPEPKQNPRSRDTVEKQPELQIPTYEPPRRLRSRDRSPKPKIPDYLPEFEVPLNEAPVVIPVRDVVHADESSTWASVKFHPDIEPGLAEIRVRKIRQQHMLAEVHDPSNHDTIHEDAEHTSSVVAGMHTAMSSTTGVPENIKPGIAGLRNKFAKAGKPPEMDFGSDFVDLAKRRQSMM